MPKKKAELARHKIMLVHEFPCVLAGAKTMIETEPSLEVVATVSKGSQVQLAVKKNRPDLALIGLFLPDMDSFDLIKEIHTTYPFVRSLAFSFREEASLMERAIDSGANGYVSMRSSAPELVHAIHATLSGGVYLEPRIAGKYVSALATESTNSSVHLSSREKEVITRVARGYCNKEISGDLGLSIKTIETYRARALEKLGTGSRAQLVELAMSEGWMDEFHSSER